MRYVYPGARVLNAAFDLSRVYLDRERPDEYKQRISSDFTSNSMESLELQGGYNTDTTSGIGYTCGW
jgi:hypothetical protein